MSILTEQSNIAIKVSSPDSLDHFLRPVERKPVSYLLADLAAKNLETYLVGSAVKQVLFNNFFAADIDLVAVGDPRSPRFTSDDKLLRYSTEALHVPAGRNQLIFNLSNMKNGGYVGVGHLTQKGDGSFARYLLQAKGYLAPSGKLGPIRYSETRQGRMIDLTLMTPELWATSTYLK